MLPTDDLDAEGVVQAILRLIAAES
jgi:hypothetical protein